MEKHEKEAQILKSWAKEKVYEKSKEKNAKGKKFYLMDGPPYATGNIHIGTALNKILKDIAMRSKRLQGYDVFDRAGYDTHGVPIEFKVEKEIGTKSKKDIEKYGVKKFVEKCKSFATRYIKTMNSEFENLGTWFNFDEPYLTLNNEYVETIWETFKVAHEKKLLYLGSYPIHVCPRCETAVAFNEIEYEKQKDTSIFVKFPLKKEKNTYLIIWTTTPWTLPANMGVMVHPNFVYQKIEMSDGEKWIIAKELVPKITSELERGYNIEEEFKGSEMEGWEYESPLSKNLKINPKNSYRVVLSGRFVNLEDGTGLVHTAPGHGKEDYEVGKESGLDIICPVDINGILDKSTGKYSGKKARIVDEEIIEDLAKDNALVYKKEYEHDYPMCWRCKSSLLMVSQPQWFFKISEIQKKILRENEKVNWSPLWMKARMKAWLEGLSDWPVSRNRYWGTPLPIWVCKKCKKTKVVGSVKELEKLSGKKVKDVHKPEIDRIILECSCKGKMERVSEVLDVWFDSGVSSWAALKLGGKNYFEKYWPADLNIEGKDQVRGWWNSQFILSQIRFGKKPFESIVEHGMVLDLGKSKMSKSKGNVISPEEIIKKYGRDSLRFYFAKFSKGEDMIFNENEMKDIGKLFMVVYNINNFLKNLEGEKSKVKIEDRWILSKYNSFLKRVMENYDLYKFYEVVKEIEEFVIKDFSRTYIRLVRERSNETKKIINEVYGGLLKILAPITPFLSEEIWNNLGNKRSIHLEVLPKVEKRKIDGELESVFSEVLQIIEIGLRERDKAQIGLKWPLSKVTVFVKDKERFEKVRGIIQSQLNVKDVKFKSITSKEELSLKLDTKMTPSLEAEGYAREVSRKIQAFRKKLGLDKRDRVETLIIIDEKFKKILEEKKNFIVERTNSKKLEFVTTSKETFKNKLDFKIKDKKGEVVIKIEK